MGTSITLCISSDTHSEEFVHFTGIPPRVGDSVVYYRRKHDGCTYSGIVTNVHHRIEYSRQDSVDTDTMQTIVVTITEKKPRKYK